MRARAAVRINWAYLGTAGQNSLEAIQANANPQLQLNLFSDLTLTAVLTRVDPTPSGGGYLWTGTVADVSNSLVQLVVKETLVAGDVRLPDLARADGPIGGEVYQIRPLADGNHIVRQLRMVAPDSAEQDYLRPPWDAMDSTATQASVGPQEDDGSIIDLLVAYSPLVRESVGGAAAIAAEIDLAVSLTNQAYANSGINQRLRLVYSVEVNYTETSLGADFKPLDQQERWTLG